MQQVIVYSILNDGYLRTKVLTDMSLKDDYESYLDGDWRRWSSNSIEGDNLKCSDDNDHIAECIEDWKESEKQ